FGITLVAGRKRVPRPATGKTAFLMGRDMEFKRCSGWLVGEAGGVENARTPERFLPRGAPRAQPAHPEPHGAPFASRARRSGWAESSLGMPPVRVAAAKTPRYTRRTQPGIRRDDRQGDKKSTGGTRTMMKRRTFLATAAAASAAAGLSALPARAQGKYPSRPIQLVVPWGAGGGTDQTARIVGTLLEKNLGQPVNVVNRIGGSGVVG